MSVSEIDMRSLKPQIEDIAKAYVGEQGRLPNANEFLVDVVKIKQCHEFFAKLENELEALINAKLG